MLSCSLPCRQEDREEGDRGGECGQPQEPRLGAGWWCPVSATHRAQALELLELHCCLLGEAHASDH